MNTLLPTSSSAKEDHFDAIRYWNDRYHSQPDLAQFAPDAPTVPPISDDCERLFSSTKLLITDRRSCLKMDIIEANECLRAGYGKPRKGTFDDDDDDDDDDRTVGI
jgi:hypothetical protein